MSNLGWNFKNSYTRLPETFFSFETPDIIPSPELLLFNNELSTFLNLRLAENNEKARILVGQILDSDNKPYSQSYAGHQYGYFTNLGDGRAVTLGEHLTDSNQRFDIQLKGSGQTKYSRRGDGKASLGPMLREYIISEAMHAFGIPTTRSLAVIKTGELVYREMPLPGAILVRVAKSHIRVGTFEYAAALRNNAMLESLALYTIDRHFPELSTSEERYIEFARKVVQLQAKLIVMWQCVGFVHGVMNTDNMLISGETIDYGPCAFMNAYDPRTVFSSIDKNSRYSFGNQPAIAKWNLARFAESMLPLLCQDRNEAVRIAEEILNDFDKIFIREYQIQMLKKIGLKEFMQGDDELCNDLLDIMFESKLDYTNTFRALPSNEMCSSGVYATTNFQRWYGKWRSRIGQEKESTDVIFSEMNRVNPAVIPRNHIVEEVLKEAVDLGNIRPVEEFIRILKKPFSIDSVDSKFVESHLEQDPLRPYRTFCGT